MEFFDDLIDLFEVYVGLLKRDYGQDDPEGLMLTAAPTNILGHDNRADRTPRILLMAAWDEQGVMDRAKLRVMKRSNGVLSRNWGGYRENVPA